MHPTPMQRPMMKGKIYVDASNKPTFQVRKDGKQQTTAVYAWGIARVHAGFFQVHLRHILHIIRTGSVDLGVRVRVCVPRAWSFFVLGSIKLKLPCLRKRSGNRRTTGSAFASVMESLRLYSSILDSHLCCG